MSRDAFPAPSPTDYYGELVAHPDPARAVGWESAAAQAARFEVVRRFVRPGDRILDLGAGLGDLGRHLQMHAWSGDYLGLERDARVFARGLARTPSVALRRADFLAEPVGSAEVVAAIGVLVDGRSQRSDALRFARARRLIEVVRAAATRTGIIIVLDQDRLEAHPILREEPALGGLRLAELAWLALDAEVVPLLSLDLALVLSR